MNKIELQKLAEEAGKRVYLGADQKLSTAVILEYLEQVQAACRNEQPQQIMWPTDHDCVKKAYELSHAAQKKELTITDALIRYEIWLREASDEKLFFISAEWDK